jgi:hypothetical protein
LRLLVWTAAFAALWALACSSVRAKPAGKAVTIPKGCEAPLGGTYQLSENPSFRYLGQDDGGTLTLRLRRTLEDGGTAPSADPGDTRLVLMRTSAGFTGETLSTQLNALKAPCPVSLPTLLTSCDKGGLTLKTVDRTEIDEECHTPPGGALGAWMTERLVRLRP